MQEVRAGVSGWIYWNLLLSEDGGPFLLSPDHADAAGNWQHPVVVLDIPAKAKKRRGQT